MVDFSAEFLQFLKAYAPESAYNDAIAEIPSGGSKEQEKLREALEARKNEIYSRYKDKQAIWASIPEQIRERFGGRVPDEVMLAAEHGEIYTLREMEYNRSLTVSEAREVVKEKYNIKIPEDIVAPAAEALVLTALLSGYSENAAIGLARSRQVREQLRDKALAGTMTAEEKKAWLESRKETKRIIEQDWAQTQPERLLIRLFAKYNNGKISKEELVAKAADLMQKIDTEGRKENLLKYMQKRPIQAKLAHFSIETLNILADKFARSVPALDTQAQMIKLIDNYNQGVVTNLQEQVNTVVRAAKQSGLDLDLTHYGADSRHPMDAELRQRFMISSSINGVKYETLKGDKINLNSDYFRSLPADIQAKITSNELKAAKENTLQSRRSISAKDLRSTFRSS